MTKFRTDNTEGYEQSDLDALNSAFDDIMAENASAWCMASPHRPGDYQSWQDHVAEKLLSAYDSGLRGEDLRRSLSLTR